MAKVLRPREAAEYLGISLRQLYNIEERDKRFPRKIIFSKRCVGFSRDSLDAYLQQKEAA